MIPSFRFYLSLLIKRLPLMLVFFALFSVAGLATAYRLPPTFKTSARLIVETPQIPDELAASTVQISAAEEIEFIRQRLFTRNNMLEIQRRFSVLQDASEMSPDQIVETMRKLANINSFESGGNGRRGENRPTLVTVSFEARTGEIAASVVNDFVTRIIDENISLRTGTAEDTLAFFQQEVDRLGDELGRRSIAISDFQRDNSDALPGDLPYRQSRLTLLQERISAAERERVSLTEQKERIQTAFERTGGRNPSIEQPQMSLEEQQLAALNNQLLQALTVYSDTNPNVVNLRNQIELLEQQISLAASEPTPVNNTAQLMLELQLSEIDSRLESLSDEIASTELLISDLVESVSRTPNVGVTLDALNRDYENTRLQYDRALASLSSANMGERIELTSRGQRITLIEPATVPDEPSSPNRPLIAAMGIAFGAGSAAVWFILLELLNRTIRRPAEMVSRIGITPIGTIPFIESAGKRVLRRTLKIAAIIGAVVAVAGGLYAIDSYYLPLELVVQKIMNRLGI